MDGEVRDVVAAVAHAHTPSRAVEVTFRSLGEHTAIGLEQRGWERLGAAGPSRRTKTERAWRAITAQYADACGITV